jgi:alpha-tubulin suppressor-like RCC1 family protein
MKRHEAALSAALAVAMLLLLLSADARATTPSVSLHAAASSVALGESLVLSGTVTHPRAGATSVAILKQAGVRWRRIAAAELTAQHVFSLEVTLTKEGKYDLAAQYAAGMVKARSAVVTISVGAAARDWVAGFCGGWGALGLGEAGTLWAWGRNDAGQLGLGVPDADPHPTPAEVGATADWAAVSGGAAHAVALKKDGTLWAWGDNSAGQLGLGETTTTVCVPTEVGSADDWASITCGARHTVALKRDGTLWAWGDNGNGRLGLGDGTQRTTPTQVGGAGDWAAVSGGWDHTLSLKKDGTLWSWGYNGNGQLGLGDTSQRLIPTQVGSAGDWAAVSGGNSCTLAVKEDGTLWSWGYNGNGQLGVGDTSERISPAQVGRDRDWAAVSCGNSHSLALKRDGSLWAFGWNGVGQLGLGDTNDRDAPTQVGSDTGWATVSGGQYSTVALKRDGTLWSWGYNANGQLGLGDTDQRDTPTEVGMGSR